MHSIWGPESSHTRCAAMISTNARELETCLTLAEVKSALALEDVGPLPGLGAQRRAICVPARGYVVRGIGIRCIHNRDL